MKKQQTLTSISNLIMYPMTVPNTGCVATGVLASGLNITVTGGNKGQAADGVENFLVEVTDPKTDYTVTKKNMHREELALLIEHHYKNRNRRRNHRGSYRG